MIKSPYIFSSTVIILIIIALLLLSSSSSNTIIHTVSARLVNQGLSFKNSKEKILKQQQEKQQQEENKKKKNTIKIVTESDVEATDHHISINEEQEAFIISNNNNNNNEKTKQQQKQQQNNKKKNNKFKDPWSWSGSSDSWSSASSSSSSSSSSQPSSSSSSSSSSPSSSSSSGGGSSSSGSFDPTTYHKFTIYNNCTESIWIASIGNPGFEPLENGGFLLARASPPKVIHVRIGWQGRIWSRFRCNFNASGFCQDPYQPCCLSGSCLTKEGAFGLHCAHAGLPPVSIVEMSLDNDSPNGRSDNYDASFVDGWSVPLSIAPVPGTYDVTPPPGVTTPWCEKETGCLGAPACPSSLSVNGTSLSCYSPCQAAVLNKSLSQHDKDRYCCVCTQSDPQCSCASSTTWGNWHYGCCRNSYGCTPSHTPPYPADQVCNPWSKTPGRGWDQSALEYVHNIRSACKNVYSWQFDDEAADTRCKNSKGLVDYNIVFVTRFR